MLSNIAQWRGNRRTKQVKCEAAVREPPIAVFPLASDGRAAVSARLCKTICGDKLWEVSVRIVLSVAFWLLIVIVRSWMKWIVWYVLSLDASYMYRWHSQLCVTCGSTKNIPGTAFLLLLTGGHEWIGTPFYDISVHLAPGGTSYRNFSAHWNFSGQTRTTRMYVGHSISSYLSG